MTQNIHFRLNQFPFNAQTEVVERKGIGHPDTLSDGIAELASIRYSEYCIRHFGFILHHNIDKVGVFGGRARFDWSSFEYDRPVRVVFGGRASSSFGSHQIPTREIFEEAAKEQFKHALPGFHRIPIQYLHLTTDSSMFARWFAPEGESDLPERVLPRSTDTAFLAAVYPKSKAELIALAVEAKLLENYWAGTDIKVLVIREQSRFSITCNVPMLVGCVNGYSEYRDRMTEAKKTIVDMLEMITDGDATLRLRALEDTSTNAEASPQECYVNVSGSAIDYGEDGLVGRGNARHGLISPAYGAGNEVLFGKNPAYQVGKVGAFIADHLAESISLRSETPTHVQIAYRRGASYGSPMMCWVTTPTEVLQSIKDSTVLCDSPGEWIRACVGMQRYRPRKPAIDQLFNK